MQFVRIREEHLELILRWRTSEQVTRHMFTDIPFDMDNQHRWYERISRDSSSRYWLISTKERPFGLVSLSRIDWVNRNAYWAYYIGDSQFHMAGAMIGPYIYHYAFDELKLHKLMGEVMEENANVRKIHLMHGCREIGFYKDHVFKYGKYHDVYLYEMLANDWQTQWEKYQKYVGSFEE